MTHAYCDDLYATPNLTGCLLAIRGPSERLTPKTEAKFLEHTGSELWTIQCQQGRRMSYKIKQLLKMSVTKNDVEVFEKGIALVSFEKQHTMMVTYRLSFFLDG